ncbi:MAG: Crp/Fnr family transcriptional regulator [Bacteroidales bacterium]|jgi:CRP/FNR family transcriptional regulator|nr:Crp/Fnr family transcriptional regulator [Bacteroidales bacterium]
MYNENVISSCEFCTNCWSNFRRLSSAERDLVNNNRYEAGFKAGEIIIKQGSPASNAIFLLSGLSKVYMEGYSGRNIILDIAGTGTLLAGPGVHVNSRYSYSVAAITQIKACFISFDVLQKVINENPQFASGFIEDLSEKSFKMHQKVISLTQKKMHGRLAEALLNFSDNIFHSEKFEMLLSRQELGELTNMAKESVVRILGELEDEKIIQATPRSVNILDRDKLRIISEKG